MSANDKKSDEAATEQDNPDVNQEPGQSGSESVPGADANAAATGEPVADGVTGESGENVPPGNLDDLGFGDARMEPQEVADADLAEALTPADIQAKLTEETARADGNWERVLRMQADMENQRKRLQKEVENARKFALEGVVNDLLPVKDSLEMGIAAARETDADPSKIIEGSDLTLKMLAQAFEKYNIVEIDPVDQKFDPEFHQAMSAQEVEGKEPNIVTAVLQKGYTLNERLIRPALVMVSK